MTTDPEFGPFLSSQRDAHEERERRRLRLGFTPQPAIDDEFQAIAEDFQVLPDRSRLLVRFLRAVGREVRLIVWWLIP